MKIEILNVFPDTYKVCIGDQLGVTVNVSDIKSPKVKPLEHSNYLLNYIREDINTIDTSKISVILALAYVMTKYQKEIGEHADEILFRSIMQIMIE